MRCISAGRADIVRLRIYDTGGIRRLTVPSIVGETALPVKAAPPSGAAKKIRKIMSGDLYFFANEKYGVGKGNFRTQNGTAEPGFSVESCAFRGHGTYVVSPRV